MVKVKKHIMGEKDGLKFIDRQVRRSCPFARAESFMMPAFAFLSGTIIRVRES